MYICRSTIILLLLCNLGSFTKGQDHSANNTKLEITKCTQLKKQLFEETVTFSALIRNGPKRHITVNHCNQPVPFIAGGSPAQPKEFPHMARLGHAKKDTSTEWFCGGTLISEKFVLTAAHCFYAAQGEPNVVRLGELIFDDNTDDARPKDYAVKRYIEHEQHNISVVYHDIGLVELNESVVFDLYKHPACLPIDSGDEFNNFLAIGWGNTKFAGLPSKKLLKVALNRFSGDTCNSIAENNVFQKLPNGVDSRSQFCAGSSRIRDTCPGDSGGPLLAYHPEYPCLYVVVGITSYGPPCGISETRGIYTRVYNYMPWITKNIWPEENKRNE